jgi:lipoic acid synthetase
MRAANPGTPDKRIPAWLKRGLPDADSLGKVRSQVSDLGLSTICFEARCPNKRTCFESGAVTFLILGKSCTRGCGFCNVAAGAPEPVDRDEPERIGRAVAGLGLTYVVITSVTRDDLEDGGSGHFAACVGVLKALDPAPEIEVLTPDFAGDLEAADRVVASGPEVFSHNLETVERLYPEVRAGAGYLRSLRMIEHVRRGFDAPVVKSGLMLGIGETIEEVETAIRDLAGAGCDIVTLGQYMRPSMAHLPVAEYLEPAVFQQLGDYALRLGIVPVCGPLVRSSFLARAAFREASSRRKTCA